MRVETQAERAAAYARASEILWPGRCRSLTRDEQQTFDGLLDGIAAFDRRQADAVEDRSDPRDGVLAEMRAATPEGPWNGGAYTGGRGPHVF